MESRKQDPPPAAVLGSLQPVGAEVEKGELCPSSRALAALKPTEVAHNPLAVLEVRYAVLASDVEAATDLRVVVEQAAEMDDGDPRIIRAFDLVRVRRVVKQHRESRVSRPHQLSLEADRERRGLRTPHHHLRAGVLRHRLARSREDYWLVQTVGALAIAIGASLGVAARRREQEPETMVLGAARCVAFGLASLRASQTESRVDLGDALLEIAFLAAWLEPAFNRVLRGCVGAST